MVTPLQINTAARQRYNAVGDDFWSDAEIYDQIYQACLEFSNEGMLIEQTYSTLSVAGQQEYSYPTNAVGIKRITYDGKKLVPYTFREDDVVTLLNQAVLSTGVPNSYAMWDNTLYLRPIPSTAGLAIVILAYIQPQQVTATSTLEIPTQYQMGIVNFVLSEMAAKNKNYQGADYYRKLWENDVLRAKKLAKRRLVTDAFQVVKNVDCIPQTDLGNI